MTFDTHTLRSELTAVDGIVALSQELVGDHGIRLLQVIKQRGADPLIGRHSFQIDSAGIRCFPRQEALAAPGEKPLEDRRLRFGIAELDEMLGGGLSYSTNTIIAGATGVGKTVLSLHYALEGAATGERTLLVTFHENATQLAYKGRLVGLDVQGALDSGTLQIRHYSVADLNVDLVAQELRESVAAGSVERLVVDGLNEIEIPLLETMRAHGFFASLIAFLRTSGITACFTLEVDPLIGRELSFVGKGFASLASNVLLLRHTEVGGRLVRTIGVLKMRFSLHDQRFHPYSITAEGLRISRAAPDTPRARRRSSR
jgi:circadian clock protein KaiC